jgi:hypothetical protein
MISFINNNSNQLAGTTNQQQNCNNNKIVTNFDINAFEFDFKDSPLQIRYPPEQTHQNYSSYDAKANSKNNFVITNPTKFEAHFENSLNKKTKSLDLFSISNQVNINIVYNNANKKSEDKTRVLFGLKRIPSSLVTLNRKIRQRILQIYLKMCLKQKLTLQLRI